MLLEVHLTTSKPTKAGRKPISRFAKTKIGENMEMKKHTDEFLHIRRKTIAEICFFVWILGFMGSFVVFVTTNYGTPFLLSLGFFIGVWWGLLGAWLFHIITKE
jgi:hypothetical protein